MMNTIKDPIRAGRSYWAMLLLSLLCITAAQAQLPTLPASPTACDYTSEPASISLTAQNVPAGYNTLYLLVNMTSGMIVQTNATAPVFNGVRAGLYYAVAAHYSSSLNNASIGKLISDVYALDQCLTYGPTLGLRVCSSACDYAVAPVASMSFTAQNVPPGVTTTYALVNDATNLIVQTSATASFSGLSAGEYSITSVHYTGSLTALATGNRLYDVTTENANCLSVSNTLHIKVCNNPIAITGPPNGGTVASLNPPISGTASPGASVTVTSGPGSTGGPCVATADVNGNWTCTSLTFTTGPSTVTATDGSTTAVSGFTVSPPVPPTVSINNPGPLVATTNVPISGTATPGSTVVLTDATNATLCTTTATAGGSYSCAVTLSPGSNTITATASNTAGTSSATTQVTAVAPPTIAILSPADNGTATTTPIISGTATPLASVTVLGPNSQSCVTTASVSGTFACSSLTFAAGPQSVTATVRNPGGTATDVNTFTVVGPPSLTVTSPVNVSTTTEPTIAGAATPGAMIVITDPLGATLCTTTASASGTFACALTGPSLPEGPNTLTVTATTPGGTTSVPVTFTTVAPPTVEIISPANNTTATTTPIISGTATPLASVTVSTPDGQSCITTVSASGTFACSSLTFAAGPQSVTATVSNPGGTFTDVTTFTALAPTIPASLTVAPTGPLTTTAPVVSGTATPGSLVTITDPLGATLCATTASASGTFACTVSVPAGPTTLTVTACTTGDCSTTTTSFTAVAPPTIAILSPADNGTATTTPTISGTATPLASVTVLGPNGQSCVTTASVSGTFACSSLTFAAGLQSVTATVATPGGTATDVNTFTVVGPPSLTVSSPVNVSTTTTPTIAGTATPGALIAITNPLGATLCSTTASASGTFACALTTPLPVGPNTLTVTATTPGGSTSVPVTFTSVAPPTVAILSPATNGTSTTTPTVSGTATPLASVTVLAPGGQSCVTTASLSGTYACSSLTFVAGPQSVTAVASNPGGTSTPAVSSFTVTDCSSVTVAIMPTSMTICLTNTLALSAIGPPGGTYTWTGAGLTQTTGQTVILSSPSAGSAIYTVTLSVSGCVTSASAVVTATPLACPPTVAIATPNNVTTTVTPTISGTATPNAVVTLTGGPGSTGGPVSVTADNTGAYSTSALTFVAGPQTVTAVASNAGGTSSPATTSFTVVGPPSLTVTSPVNVSTTTTPTIAGTATPGALIAITDPLGATLCSTTASASGTFACALTSPLPVGPTTLTVTATTPGGKASVPVTFTTVASPTIAIFSPADNGTATTTPTVSGTATPLASVTILGPNSQVCITTASLSGTYACLSLTFAAGPQSVTATVTTPGGTATDVNTFTAIAPVASQPPVVIPDIANTSPGKPVSGNVLTNDSDPTGLPLTASVTTLPTAGTVVMSPTGSYTYTPPAGFTGTVSFCYTASNTAGLSASTCVSINVNPDPSPIANDAPIANNDATQMTAGTSVIINVVANDTDPDSATTLNGQLSAPVILSQPSVGTAVVNANGTVTYTPPVGFTGVVSFPYSVCDKATPALCATAVVSVNVQPTPPVGTTLSPVAIDDALLATRNTPATGTVAANDSDPAGLPLTYTSGQPTSGTVMMSPTGSYTYTPAAGYVGPTSFTYSVCNSAGKCDVATVSVNVQIPVNQSPQVTPDFNDVVAGIPATGNVLTNDKDPEGQPLTASVVGTPPAGFTLSPDGSYTYTAPIGTTAPVTLPIQVCDGATPPSCATTTLTLIPVPVGNPATNDAPIANPDSPKTTAGVPVIVAVLANDVDPEGQPLSNPVIVTQPTHGTALVNPDGTVSYTPTAGYTGTDQLTYSVCDGGTPPACSTALVTFSIESTPPAGVTNTAPIAIDDALLTQKGVSATGTVASNDRDPQGQSLVFAKLTNPASGTVVFSPTGSYTYVPAPGFTGSDAFTYQVCDNATPALCATATVHLTVQPAVINTLPLMATSDIANTNVNVPATGNVLSNDTDPQGLPLTASVTTLPTAGTVTMSPDGTYVYTPPTDFTGTASFCYSVSNSAGLSASACVSVNVNPIPSVGNDRPIANNDNTQTTSGTSVTVVALANDTDPDLATTLAGQLANPVILSQPSVGTAVVNANGTVTYTPPVGFTGVVSFPYSVCDKATPALCATAVVSVDVQPTPPVGTTLAPVAIDDALLVSINTPKVGDVSANDSDPNTPTLPLIFTAGQPANGTVVMSPTGSYTYTPAPGYSGPDSFIYLACNSAGKCDVATVSVNVQVPVNQSPQVTPDFNDVVADIPATGNVLTNDKDPEGQPLTASVVGTPPAGFTLSPDGSYTYTAPVGTTAPVTVPIQVCDGATPPSCATTTLTLIPVPVGNPTTNDAPIANPDSPKTTAGVPVIVAVLANDVDPEGQPLSNPVIVTQPTHGTALVNPDGTVSYTPTAGYTGTDQLTYSVCDGSTPPACSTALVTFSIESTPPAGVTNTAPIAIDDALLTQKGVSATGTVASNDRDPQGQSLVFAKLTNPVSGTVVFSPTGSYTYVPAPGFTGSDAFTYQVCDNATPALCATATVHLTVQPSTPPTIAILSPADNGTATTTPTISGTATPLASVTVLAPGGQSCITTASASGTFACSSLTFAAGPQSVTAIAGNVNGTATDVNTFTAVGPPSLTVTSPNGVSTTTTPTIAGTATPGALIAITDPLGATLCSTTASASGTFACALTSPLPVGPTTLTVTATTPGGTTSRPIAFTTVAPPTVAILSPADNGTATTTPTISGTATPLASVTVLAPGGQSCITTASASGTFACSSLTFAAGPQSVTAVVSTPGGTVTDVNTFKAVAPVVIKVPVVIPDIANTSPGKPVIGNVLTNDSDPTGLPLTASVTTLPTAGTVVMSPTGSYTYTPPAGFTGTVSFCYTASNTAGLSASTCVSINVEPDPVLNTNNRPIANNDNVQTTSGQSLTIAILANDADPDSATSLNGQLAVPTLVSQPGVGTAVMNATGIVTYTSPVGFTGVVSFAYQVCDKATPALCATAVVSVNVQPTPPVGTTLAPDAVDDALLLTANMSATGTVAANDRDPQGLPLTYNAGQPKSGTVVMSPTGSYIYTPTAGYSGGDSFTYSVCNSAGGCDIATVSVLVQQPVDPGAVVLRLKVMLQGALIGGTGGLMRDDLRSQNFLPLTEPYSAMGGARFTHVNGGGGETMPASVTALNVGTGDAVVDWVFVELRSPSNLSLVVATRSAMVQRDGDVVLASDGVSPLSFSGLTGSSFYVSVKHRNHLGAMTAASIPLSATGTIVDFTTSNSSQLWNTVIGVYNYEGWEQTTQNGKQALWAGDANHSGKVKYQGSANDLITIFSEVIGAQSGNTNPLYNYNSALGYYFGDVNMDGKVKYQGTSNDTPLIFTNVLTNYSTLNSGQLYNFDWMLEQIPN